MFWIGNYMAAREVNAQLKEPNVTLTQLMDADDILQECQAQNPALVDFLIKPEVITQLISLITEEPSQTLELQSQYRYSSIACEMLTSGIPALSVCLSNDATLMNKLCDFINRDPPLNPLLASFFSKTMKMLVERCPKQDWYTYHIVCLHVVECLKSRTDFLPNLFRHIGTSAIMDTFKYLIRLDVFSAVILEWFGAHQLLEVLIQILCGTYIPEEVKPSATSAPQKHPDVIAKPQPVPEVTESEGIKEEPESPKENGETDDDSKDSMNIDDKGSDSQDSGTELSGKDSCDKPTEFEIVVKESQIAAGRSANAAGLLCDIILRGCYGEGSPNRPQTGSHLMAHCKSEQMINLLLQSMFTSPQEFRRHAIVNGVQVLLALLEDDPVIKEEDNEVNRRAVVSAVAPHLPLLHQTLLQETPVYPYAPEDQKTVGMARLQVVTLMAALASSPAEEVSAALIALGTPATMLDLFFSCPGNNFLHAQTLKAIAAALVNVPFQTQYARHILIECDLLTRLMDAYEVNEKQEGSAARAGYMGHAILLLETVMNVLDSSPQLLEQVPLPEALTTRWRDFTEQTLVPLLKAHSTPLGGTFPSETTYEVEAPSADGNYDFNDIAATIGGVEELGMDDNATDEVFDKHYDNYQYNHDLQNYAHRMRQTFGEDDKQWDEDQDLAREEFEDSVKVRGQILDAVSPWDSAAAEGGDNNPGEGWAQFSSAEDNDKFGDEFTSSCQPDDFATFWDFSGQSAVQHDTADTTNKQDDIHGAMQNLHLLSNQDILDNQSSTELANQVSNLLTAFTSISPEVLASLVNANMPVEHSEIDNIEKIVEEQIQMPEDTVSESSEVNKVVAEETISSLVPSSTEIPKSTQVTVVSEKTSSQVAVIAGTHFDTEIPTGTEISTATVEPTSIKEASDNKPQQDRDSEGKREEEGTSATESTER